MEASALVLQLPEGVTPVAVSAAAASTRSSVLATGTAAPAAGHAPTAGVGSGGLHARVDFTR